MRDHTKGRVDGFLSQVRQDSSQEGTYMQRTSPTRRGEYLEGDSDSDGYRRPHQDQRTLDRRGYPDGRPPDRGGGPPDRGGGPPWRKIS